jgi:hypothetical protein
MTVTGPDFGNVSSVRRLVGSWWAGLSAAEMTLGSDDDPALEPALVPVLDGAGDCAATAFDDIASAVVSAAVAPTAGNNRRRHRAP